LTSYDYDSKPFHTRGLTYNSNTSVCGQNCI